MVSPGLGFVAAAQSEALHTHSASRHSWPAPHAGEHARIVVVVVGVTQAPSTHACPAAQHSLRPHLTFGGLHFFFRFFPSAGISERTTAASAPPARARREVRRVRCSLNRLTN